jgi:uridine kinase
MANSTAPAALTDLAGLIHDQSSSERPLLVGVDGVTGAGKTTLAETIGQELKELGTPAFVISVDHFHNPRAIRHSLGRNNPEGYYRHSHDYNQLNRLVIEPLRRPGSCCTIVPRAFDLELDCEALATPVAVQAPAVVIVEGSFVLRESLRGIWDFSLYVMALRRLAVSRVTLRDERLFESQGASRITAETIVAERYHGAHDLHDRWNQPRRNADLCIENSDPQRPMITCHGTLRHRRRTPVMDGTPFLSGVSAWIRTGPGIPMPMGFESGDQVVLWDDRAEAARGLQLFAEAAGEASGRTPAAGPLSHIGFECDCATLCHHIAQSAHAYFGRPARVVSREGTL